LQKNAKKQGDPIIFHSTVYHVLNKHIHQTIISYHQLHHHNETNYIDKMSK